MSDAATASFESYSGLVAMIADWIERDDLLTKIPHWIRLIEAELSRDLGLREQDKVKEGVLDVNDDFIELPGDYLWGKHLRLDTDPVRTFNYLSTDKWIDVRENKQGNPHPSAVTVHGNRLYLAPTPNSADPYTLWYKGRLTPLSRENESNRVLTDAPDALLYGALKHGAPYMADDARLPVWIKFADESKASLMMMDWRAKTSGGALQVRPDVGLNDAHHTGRVFTNT